MISFGVGLNDIGVLDEGWNPSLIVNGAEGGLYEPWDLSTMFQDGATPVTGPDQTVGLMLDKRLWGGRDTAFVMMEQPELLTNSGGPFNTTTGYQQSTTFGANLSVSSGELIVTPTIGNGRVVTPVFMTAGQGYKISGTMRISSGLGTCFIGLSATTGGAGIITSPSTTSSVSVFTETIYIPTTTGTFYVVAGNTGGSVAVCAFGNISVKLIPGNHLSQTTSGARPKLGRHPVGGRRNLLTYTDLMSESIWVKTGSTVSNQGGGVWELAESTANSQHLIYHNGQSVVSGTTYTTTLEVKANGRSRLTIAGVSTSWSINSCTFDLNTQTYTLSGAGTASISDLGDGWRRISYTRQATGTATGANARHILFIADSEGATSYLGDGVSGMLVRNPQFEINGFTPYQRVVSAFDVTEQGVRDCWYLGFDGVDDVLFHSSGALLQGSDLDMILCAQRTNISTVPINGGGGYVAVAQASDVRVPDENSGTPTYRVNGVPVARTRGAVHSAWTPNVPKVIEIDGAILNSLWTSFRIGFYSSGFNGVERVYGLMLVKSPLSDVELDQLRNYFILNTGITI